jgi:hypothetical protein
MVLSSDNALTVPDDAALTRASSQVEEIYAVDLSKAKSSQQQSALAHEMILAAQRIDDDPAGVFGTCQWV